MRSIRITGSSPMYRNSLIQHVTAFSKLNSLTPMKYARPKCQGKGCIQRPFDTKKFQEEYERIFRKKKPESATQEHAHRGRGSRQ